MSRSKQTSKVKRRRKAVTAALGVAGALSLASGASASTACGEQFTPKRNDAVTCSNRCRQRLFRQRAR